MHEMSIAQSLLKMSEEEISRQGCTRLEVVNVKYGALAGIVAESLQFCFETMIQGTPHEGARLNWKSCPCSCTARFAALILGAKGKRLLYSPVPVAASNSDMW